MADTIIFDGITSLTFIKPGQPGQASDRLEVRINSRELLAARLVYDGDNGFAYLAEYFQDLAESWRGWDGERAFESVEGDLRISATHDGHVRAVVRLQGSLAEPMGWWRVEVMLRIDAGEQLAAAARDVLGTLRA